MKIFSNSDICEANAICARVCPEVFRVNDDDTMTVLVTEVPEEHREHVEEAVRLCPRQALRVED